MGGLFFWVLFLFKKWGYGMGWFWAVENSNLFSGKMLKIKLSEINICSAVFKENG